MAPLQVQGRRRRAHILDGAALEGEEEGEEELIDGGDGEWMLADQAESNGLMTEKEGQGMEEVFASLSSMKVEVEGLRNPLGTYHSPARTCKELWLLHPELPNGTHSVDERTLLVCSSACTHSFSPAPARRVLDRPQPGLPQRLLQGVL